MTVPAIVERLPLIAVVEARLADRVPASGDTPAYGYLTEPVNVPQMDGDGHVQRYWVLHPFNGTPGLEPDLADQGVELDWPLQVTVAAGFPRDCYALAELVDAALYRWTPTVAGYVCGPLKPPPGYDPGPVRPDLDVKPHRFWLPLQYRTTITRSV